MAKLNWFIMFIVISNSLLATAQVVDSKKHIAIIPESIYSMTNYDGSNSFENFYFKKNLDNIRFLKIDQSEIQQGYLLVPFQKFSSISANHFFETYQRIYYKMALTKDFYKDSDFRNFSFHDYKSRFKRIDN